MSAAQKEAFIAIAALKKEERQQIDKLKSKAYDLKMLLAAGLAACRRIRILIRHKLDLSANIKQKRMSGDTSRLFQIWQE